MPTSPAPTDGLIMARSGVPGRRDGPAILGPPVTTTVPGYLSRTLAGRGVWLAHHLRH
jgi:hypothetical protein